MAWLPTFHSGQLDRVYPLLLVWRPALSDIRWDLAGLLSTGWAVCVGSLLPFDYLLSLTQQTFPKMETTFGVLEPPLGNTRLQIAKLFATLFAVNDSDLHLCLIEHDVVNRLLVRRLDSLPPPVTIESFYVAFSLCRTCSSSTCGTTSYTLK